ncbi:MAG: hypothetical protein J5783_08180 [Lachnospiraceae bacterium]|nr:hypothetical protein [Lachnospiraceae bacterium]
MKKAVKLLAAMLVLVLVIGTIPVQAAEKITLKKSSKVLYLGGCKGKKANGKKAKYYSFVKVGKLLSGDYNSKTMDFKLEADDPSIVTVSNKTGKVKAKKIGETEVVITVRDKKTEAKIATKILNITVKKNSDKNFEVSGIADGKEYKVGDTITVKMPRGEYEDCRRLTCSSSDVELTAKKGTSGAEYTVKFNKAGSYTIKAETYQTSTYSGTIYAKSFNVTVKGEDKPEPTVTPTPVDSALSVKQTALDTIVISGFGDAASVKGSDLDIYYDIAGTKIPANNVIKSVTADGDKVVVAMVSPFIGGTEYFVNKKGSKADPAKFKAATATEKDIASVSVSVNKALVGEYTDLGIKYYNKDKIDITSGINTLMISVDTVMTDSNTNFDAFASGTSVYFYKANISREFEVIVKIYSDNREVKSGKFTVVSYEPVPNGMMYTIKEETGTYLKETDTCTYSFAYNASKPVIEVLFKYVDAAGKVTWHTLAEEGITSIKPADETVLFVGAQSATGGWYLKPNKTGSTSLLFYKGDNIVPGVTARVTVTEDSKPTTVTATVSKANLNVNTTLGDKLEIKAVVKDQYGNEMKGQAITIEQTEATKATGTAYFGTFDPDGVLVVNGSNITLNAGKKNGVIAAVIKCGSSNPYPVQFNVADVDKAEKAVLTSNPNQENIILKTGIKEGDVKPESVTLNIQSQSQGFAVKNEIMKHYTKQLTPQVTNTDLGVAVNDVVYLYTVYYTDANGKSDFMKTLPAIVFTDGLTELQIKAYDHQVRLDEGTYLIDAYKVVAGAANSSIERIGTRKITVVNDKPEVSFKQIKVTSTNTVATEVAKECFEFYINGKKVENPNITAADMNTGSDGSKFIKSVNLAITNSVYGNYEMTIKMENDSKVIK